MNRKSTYEIRVERLDDIPLLLALQQRIGLDELVDSVIPRHANRLGLSIGQLVIGWNAYILSQADHRKVAVEQWAVEHQSILSELLSTAVRRTDFTDDRLASVLCDFADDCAWEQIEQLLWENTVSVYQLTPERVRLDATRFSGYHTPTDEGVMQRGYNKNTPHLAQVKLMAASIDCSTSGHLLVSEVVSGEKADDPLYLPAIDRVRQTLGKSGLLYVGDSKMSSVEIRAGLSSGGDFYLVPLALVGEVGVLYDQWVDDITSGCQPATLIYKTDANSQASELVAGGYQTCRCQSVLRSDGSQYRWQERVLVVRSLSKANKQFADLQQRITDARAALLGLTPDPGRGRRVIRQKAQLVERAEAILSAYDVSDYLQYSFKRQTIVEKRYVGPGRGSQTRETKEIRTVRYQITSVVVDEQLVADAFCRMGWRVYATNQPEDELSLQQAVLLYRAAPRIERHFHLFKSAPIGISPLYVRNDDQIKGLTRLLSLGVRLMTLIEIVARRYLAQHQMTLAGLYEGNPNRQTAMPTAQRLLKAFRPIHRLNTRDGPIPTQLSSLQNQILVALEIEPGIYQSQPLVKTHQSFISRLGHRLVTRIKNTFDRVGTERLKVQASWHDEG